MRASLLVVATLLVGCTTLFGDLGPPRDRSLSRVGALEGCWVGMYAGATMEECWSRPSGGAMFGHSRAVAAGLTVSFEHLRLEQRGDDTYYIAMPQGTNTTEFTLRPSGPDSLVFENASNDFPRRIFYFVSNRHLGVRLEGTEAGAARVVDYTLHRR